MATFVTACCTLFAATNGAEQVDSGWAIAIPSPLATGPTTTDTHQQIILRQVLDEMQQPLLQKPSPTSAKQLAPQHEGHTGLRFAVRPDGVEGWRAAGPALAPLDTPAAKDAGPQLGAPIKAGAGEDEAECDCSGESTAHESTKKTPAQNATPSLADAYGELSAAVDSANNSAKSAKSEAADSNDG